MIPKTDKSLILDIGWGSGIPTVELASLEQRKVIGIDIDQPTLDKFNRKVQKAGLTNQIRAVNYSMFDIGFPGGNFNIICSEANP